MLMGRLLRFILNEKSKEQTSMYTVLLLTEEVSAEVFLKTERRLPSQEAVGHHQ